MKKIINSDIQKSGSGKSDITKRLYLEEMRGGRNDRQETIEFSVDDALKIVDDTVKYLLNDGTYTFIPKRDIWDFDSEIGPFVNVVHEATDAISDEEYLDFCRKRLDNYRNYGYSDKRICETFFARYAPLSVQQKYRTVWDMLKAHINAASLEAAKPVFERVGGEVTGFYTDDKDRVRPVTERKHLELVDADYVAMLKVAFGEEICNEQ